MNIVPKLSTFYKYYTKEQIEELKKNKRIEIQILKTEEINKNMVKKAVETFPYIEEFIFHTPMDLARLEFLAGSKYFQEKTNMLLDSFEEFPNIKFNLLFHAELETKAFVNSGCFDFIKKLAKKVENTNTTILLENALLPTLACYEIAKKVNSPNLRVCYDICHHLITKQRYAEYYVLPDDFGKYIKSIHFSDSGNGDGIRNPDTHSNCHETIEDCECTLLFLKKIGFDFKNGLIVTEICEPNGDYINRPSLMQELKFLEEIKTTNRY